MTLVLVSKSREILGIYKAKFLFTYAGPLIGNALLIHSNVNSSFKIQLRCHLLGDTLPHILDLSYHVMNDLCPSLDSEMLRVTDQVSNFS